MTKDNSSAQLVDDLRAALNWCVSNSGECLGDHPDRLKRFDALIDQTLSIALTRPQPPTSSVEAVARAELLEWASQHSNVTPLDGTDRDSPTFGDLRAALAPPPAQSGDRT